MEILPDLSFYSDFNPGGDDEKRLLGNPGKALRKSQKGIRGKEVVMAVLAECPACHKKQKAKNNLCKSGEDLVKAKKNEDTGLPTMLAASLNGKELGSRLKKRLMPTGNAGARKGRTGYLTSNPIQK